MEAKINLTKRAKLLLGIGLLVACMTAVLVMAAMPAAYAGNGALDLLTKGSQQQTEGIERAVFSEAEDGYSLLYDSSKYVAIQQVGEDVFVLSADGKTFDETSASYFMVGFYPSSETMPTHEVLAKDLREIQESFPNSEIEIIGEEVGISIAGVHMEATALYVDDQFFMIAVENRGDTVAYWYIIGSDEDTGAIMEGLTEAVATFKPSADYFNDTSVIVTDASLLETRPVQETVITQEPAKPSKTGAGKDAFSKLGDDQTPTQEPTTSTEQYTLEAVQYTDGWSFTINVPKGWTVKHSGYGESALIEAYDPQNPAYRMSYYSNQNLPGSQLTASLIGFPFIMESGTLEAYINLLPDIGVYADEQGYEGMPGSIRLVSAKVTEIDPITSITDFYNALGMGYLISDESVVRADIVFDDGKNTKAEGIWYGAVLAESFGSFVNYDVITIYGVTAPQGELDALVTALANSGCLGSFAFTDAYVKTHEDTSSDISQLIIDTYNDQQATQERIFQAWDDYIRS
ncbi:MAG: hypothetical protein IKE43_01665 [Coriobacteriales bacterium]|nr:hypothetical protein [Coriobacteriales bacterium]